ncbi:tetratricopeptide repeat protein [Cryptosporangium sp. NPDC051539]|uniref:tetratricopeptide repeat protein n=1 Tax=Cryptosporangium sp. NPDC051539 TaxID=3363962 RepID=UPI0037B97991
MKDPKQFRSGCGPTATAAFLTITIVLVVGITGFGYFVDLLPHWHWMSGFKWLFVLVAALLCWAVLVAVVPVRYLGLPEPADPFELPEVGGERGLWLEEERPSPTGEGSAPRSAKVDQNAVAWSSGTVLQSGRDVHQNIFNIYEAPSSKPLSRRTRRVKTTNLPPRNPSFSGREECLEKLTSTISDGPVTVLAVGGLGGIGKTQIALEFAHRGADSGRYPITWLVRADSKVTIAKDIAALAPTFSVKRSKDIQRTISGVLDALRSRADWLIIFDNAPSADFIRLWLPGGAGHTLITSRDHAGWQDLARTIDLAGFTKVESMSYVVNCLFGSDAADEDELTAVRELVEALDNLPLALAQAVSYAKGCKLSVRGYLDLYRDRAEAGRLLAQKIGGYPESVATTWLIHFRDLARDNPAAMELLQLCSFLAPDEIDLLVILFNPELLQGELTGRLAETARSRMDVQNCVAALLRTGLITRIDDARIRIHRLVAEVTRLQLDESSPADKGTAADWTLHVLQILRAVMPDNPWEYRNWPVVVNLIPHIESAVDRAILLNVADDNAGIALTQLGTYLWRRGSYSAACDLLERAVAIKDNFFDEENSSVATSLNGLGVAQLEAGFVQKSKQSFGRALGILEVTQGPRSVEYARILSNLGHVQQKLYANGNEATKSYLQSNLILEERLGKDHPFMASNVVGIARIKINERAYAEAAKELSRALHIYVEAYGPDHLDVARTRTELAVALQLVGDLRAAVECHTLALRVYEVSLGSDHPFVATTLLNLGNLEQARGNNKAARPHIERAIAIQGRLPLEHRSDIDRARRLLAEKRRTRRWRRHLGRAG